MLFGLAELVRRYQGLASVAPALILYSMPRSLGASGILGRKRTIPVVPDDHYINDNDQQSIRCLRKKKIWKKKKKNTRHSSVIARRKCTMPSDYNIQAYLLDKSNITDVIQKQVTSVYLAVFCFAKRYVKGSLL